jgi:hypothetical protein
VKGTLRTRIPVPAADASSKVSKIRAVAVRTHHKRVSTRRRSGWPTKRPLQETISRAAEKSCQLRSWLIIDATKLGSSELKRDL